jgi:hypothetical protein
MSALRQSDSDALRALVREVLRDLVPKARGQGPATPGAPANATEAPRVESVSISSDAELRSFVRRLLDLSADPGGREALRSGRHDFRLANGGGASCAGNGAEPVGGPERNYEERIDRGVLSESKVIGLARSGRRIVLGKRVVVTPLARDKARQLGVKLERDT